MRGPRLLGLPLKNPQVPPEKKGLNVPKDQRSRWRRRLPVGKASPPSSGFSPGGSMGGLEGGGGSRGSTLETEAGPPAASEHS